MLLHVTPTFRTCARSGRHVELIDYRVANHNLTLKAGEELVTRRPHPNKTYQVACRRIGQKAIDGLLFELPDQTDAVRTVARWSVNAEFVVVHEIEYRIQDRELDAATDNALLWHRTHLSLGDWENRCPTHLAMYSPMQLKSCFSLKPEQSPWHTEIASNRHGDVVARRQIVELPTVERGRLCGRWAENERVPKFDHKISLGSHN
ncbi:hypothetical protein AWH63_10330 [Marinobacter sp. C18]|uniref:DUF6012 family protein n=1 Tax=Marinobacter sp. C18 TaxID=1772288 RepID=UPI0009490A08|nr:DUF6012 family protein [Marinobacter sp. C18]OLF81929.1 hypothetical protein AWH63_10330 [Marinobacter sp. C18]